MGDFHGEGQQERKNFDRGREGGRDGFRGGRGPGNREGGGFRIRLSENEMRAARNLQEAFNLRSTVAVLGFALRTLGQMLEEGKLDELIKEAKADGPARRDRDRNSQKGNRFNRDRDESNSRGPKPNPFARPAKPQQPKEEPANVPEEAEDQASQNGEEESSLDESKSNEIIEKTEHEVSSEETKKQNEEEAES